MKSNFIKSLKFKCKCNNYMGTSLKTKIGVYVVTIGCKNCDSEKGSYINYSVSLDINSDKVLINVFKSPISEYMDFGFVYYYTKTIIVDDDILINDWETFEKILLLQDRQKIEEKYKQYILFM